jgi:RNA polymerase sigma-70 factor (ECF subfamily)
MELEQGSLPAEPTEGLVGEAWRDHRRHLVDVAYRLVGSVTEAEDMVQEAFARLLRAEQESIDDVRGWLVVVVTRLCLDLLRSARVRRETYVGPWFPEPVAHAASVAPDPADIVTLDESVRMALLIVLERLSPAERVVFVLHDVFEYTFEEIAPMVDRAPAACRQLASRARRRVGAEAEKAPAPVEPEEMRRVAERFIAAVENGELQPLLEVLDPQVVGWADLGGGAFPVPQPSSGRDQVAQRVLALFGRPSGAHLLLAEVNGEPGIIAAFKDRPVAVMVLTARDQRITSIYAIGAQAKLGHVTLPRS